jgi:hypothetical protein
MDGWTRTEFGMRRQKPGSPYGIVRAPWEPQPKPEVMTPVTPQAPQKVATEGPMKAAIGLLTDYCGVQPGLVATIKAQAKAAGISISTLKRAKKFLGIKHVERDGQSFWALAAGVDP